MLKHFVWLTSIVLFCSGCGSGAPTSDVVPTVSAAGKLSFQGKPLPYYQVTVMPEGNRPAIGVTNEQGEFVLGTNAPEDGAVVGTHPVAISYVGPPSANPEEGMNVFTPPPPPPVKLPKKYSHTETSGLTVEIPEDGTTGLVLDLK